MREAGCIIPLALVHLRKKLGAFLIFVVHFWKTVVHFLFSWCKRECVVHYSI